MISSINSILKSIYNLILPAVCISCDDPLPEKRAVICSNCYNAMEKILPKHKESFLERVEDKHFDNLFIKFQFSQVMQMLMHYFKYEGYMQIADYFVVSISEELKESYGIISCVPLHISKKRERGFNQSEIIARKVCQLMGKKWFEVLQRTRYTNSQTRLSRSERKANMKNAFSVNVDVKDKSVLLIDDVITTGATLNECARILKNGGARRVDVFAMATPVDILQNEMQLRN